MESPSNIALQHSQKLISHIYTQVQQEKESGVSFAEYMNLCLYAPELGYYHAGTQKFGLQGDFITAPEISPLFSYCLANQCRDICERFPPHTPYSILEIGAGSGQMAVDILIQLSRLNSLPEHYSILELSPDLKERQQQKIQQQCPEFFNQVQWLAELPATPFKGIILANEVLDAMPVHVFKKIKGKVHEQRVKCAREHADTAFEYHYVPTSQNLAAYFQEDFIEGYVTEINFNIKPWIQSLSDCLTQGAILLIDYGFPRKEYYHPDRHMGTLMCHYQHRAHTDPFFHPGLQDITAHVDFTAVAEAAFHAQLEVLGYTHQAAFLLSSGLLEFCQAPDARTNQAIHTLTSPSEMGELFKVIVLGKAISHPLLGFQMSNRVGAL